MVIAGEKWRQISDGGEKDRERDVEEVNQGVGRTIRSGSIQSGETCGVTRRCCGEGARPVRGSVVIIEIRRRI